MREYQGLLVLGGDKKKRDPLAPAGTNAINARSIGYETMLEAWDLPCDLLGGTRKMRENADKWLPPEAKEELADYTVRVSRTVLYEAYRILLETLSNKPFARAITIKGILPDPIAALVKDADRTGLSISALGEEMLFCMMHFGLTHMVCDYPSMPAGATRETEEKMRARPTFIHVPASRLFSWTLKDSSDGTPTLESIRILECKVLKSGYAEQEQYYIREYTESGWALYKEVERKARDGSTEYVWEEAVKGQHSFKRVPIYTTYARRTGFMTGAPAFEPVAWLNLAHFQSMSDQRNILRFTRLGLLFGSGFTTDEVQNGIVIAPSKFVGSTNPDAKLSYVESDGAAMEIGRHDLEDLEFRMEVAGHEVLSSVTGNGESATGSSSKEHKNRSFLQIWVKNLEDMFHTAITEAAAWIKKPVSDLTVDIYNDFTLSPRSRDDMLALLEARRSGEIGRKRFWLEWQRRGMFEELINVDEEILAAVKDQIEDAKRAQEYQIQPAGGSSRLGGTGGSGTRNNLNDTNGGKSRRRGENRGARGNENASGTTGA